jgi:hypothetical protein
VLGAVDRVGNADIGACEGANDGGLLIVGGLVIVGDMVGGVVGLLVGDSVGGPIIVGEGVGSTLGATVSVGDTRVNSTRINTIRKHL